MLRKITIVTCLTIYTALMFGGISAKADTITANNMIPVLRTMYNVDAAEAILSDKVTTLNIYKKANASTYEIALAQAAVNDASNLVNTLNTMIARDTIIIQAAPPGVVNTPSLSTNSLMAQGAWNDFIKKEKAGHVMLFPTGPVPTPAEIALASSPFSMY